MGGEALTGAGRLLIVAAAAWLLGGCAENRLARNVYEGARVRDEALQSTPLENPKGQAMPYEQYERARRGESDRRRAMPQ